MQSVITPNTEVEYASDLGLEPGEWPLRLWYSGRGYLRVEFTQAMSGEVTGAVYTDAHGPTTEVGVLTLVVVND